MTQLALAGRQRPLRVHLREGMEAALKAEPHALAAADPRTLLGMVIRELGFEAARGKTPAVKLMLQMIDWKEPRVADQRAANDDEPGVISGLAHEQGVISRFEPVWDWDATGRWETEREPAPAAGPASAKDRDDAAAKAHMQFIKEQLREKLSRRHDAQSGRQEQPTNEQTRPGSDSPEAGRGSGP